MSACGSSTPARPPRRSRCSRSRFSAGSSRGRPTRRWTSCSQRFKLDSGLVFTLDTLEYLARGGRIGRAAGWAGQLLHIKPILTLADGEVLPVKRVRGNRKAIQEFANALEAGTRDAPGVRVAIAHADAPERMDAVEKLVRDLRPQAELEITTTLGPVLGTHAGPGTVGLFWLEDELV